MPDLEKQIAEWRRQMLAAGIKSPVPLEELESHLREEVAKLMKSGLSAEKAFAISAGRMGQPEVLKREFKKVERTSIKWFGIFAVLVGAVIILRILTHHPDPAHLRRNEQVQWLFAGSAILLLGVRNLVSNSSPGDARDIRRWRLVGISYSVLAVWISILPIYLFLTVPIYSEAVGTVGRILTFTGLAVSVLSVFGWKMSRGILPIIPSKRNRTIIGFACCLLGTVLATLFFIFGRQLHFSIGVILATWTWAVMAILGGVGYGLTEAARRQTELTAS